MSVKLVITIVEKEGECSTKMSIQKDRATDTEHGLARTFFELIAAVLVSVKNQQDESED